MISILFCHAQQWTIQTKIKGEITFTLALKLIKYLGINLTKEVKDQYIENFKTLKINHSNRWKKWITNSSIIQDS